MAITITNTIEDFEDLRNLQGDSLYRQIIGEVSEAGLEEQFYSFVSESIGDSPVTETFLHDVIRYDEGVRDWLRDNNVGDY